MNSDTITADEVQIGTSSDWLVKAPLVSIGILAWNEEKSIGAALDTLFQQSIFARLCQRGQRCEVVFVGNGCTDGTADIVAKTFADQTHRHPQRDWFECRQLNLQERGKLNAWNSYIHSISAREADYIFLMDADILINGPDTLWNMLTALEADPQGMIATDQPCKDISHKRRKSFSDRFSLSASHMTSAGSAQLCAQLYCIRAETARHIYLPKDLSACEDGFIKWIVCTDFLTHEANPGRIICVPEASHTFEAYTSLGSILKNQKRQMIGQALVHVLIDEYLPTLTPSERKNLATTLRDKDRRDPLWLKRLIADHVKKSRPFWRLIPGLVGFRFRRLAQVKGVRKITCLPVALAGFAMSMLTCFMAHGFLKHGSIAYWPHAKGK